MEDKKNNWKNLRSKVIIPLNMYIDICSWENNVLTISLRSGDGSKKFRVMFSDPLAYRFNVNESHRAQTWFSSTFPEYITNIRYLEESEYIEWLKDEDGNVHDFKSIKHFLLGSEEIIEVLCENEPTIETVSINV